MADCQTRMDKATIRLMQPDRSFDAILPTPFGTLGMSAANGCLTGLSFLPPGTRPSAPPTPFTQHVAAALSAYFSDPGHAFDLALAASGTPFRQRVWAALLAIPVGQVISYGELARRVGSAPRAVGQAVGDNPIPIIIPCHRVVAADGGLGGFMHSRTGYSQDIKRWLLGHEHAL